MKGRRSHTYTLLLTCEHAGNKIPRKYARLFRGAATLLNSHRGWDPGALELTRYLSGQLNIPFHHVLWSRLLVESNRSPTNPRIWSKFTADLPTVERKEILETYWRPNRIAVEHEVNRAVKRGDRVFHVAIHSFTPVLHGEKRNADIALLYDSAIPAEKSLCRNWKDLLNQTAPEFRVRLNYPYRGNSDGLSTWLRKKFPARNYIGVEFEFNQGLIGTSGFAPLKRAVARSIGELLGR